MNNQPSTSKQSALTYEDEEVFEDSTILANFNNSSFKDTSARVSSNNINNSLNKSGLNVSALCCDEEINGYDKLTGQTWVYPTNYPVRDYQFNIIKAAILKNTLVSLPTGLGKTFIAAVIMYNFYRWYPLGKIIFTAPTRPLVAQQIEACYNIVAIPSEDTVEMTGHMQVSTRKIHWKTKRVFFATPQVIYNDIKSNICPADQIRCLVIDEAHRAKGNYAYCQIVATLTDMGCKTYRVLALSATPGSKVEDVVNVVKNLHIAHLELRTEQSIDVMPYSHARNINTVVIPLGPELSQLRHHYVEILDGYARRLKQFNILPHNVGNLSKGRIVLLYKQYQNMDRSNRHPQHNYIMKDFTMLIALYHGLELLTRHGSRVFLNFFDEHPEKSWIQSDDRLTALLERLRDDLGINPLALDRSILPDGSVPEMPKNLTFGHPKFYKLKEILLEHFNRAKQKEEDTRAIVFCEYRESVNLVHCLLLSCRPLIVPLMFVGQGASGKDGKTVISQKQQLRVMRSFREGACNVLVATCVAEEGLDVGSVDLIVCFDISTRSPIRLVQRCGRTGRERGGQVHILVTEGREHQTLQDSMRQRDGLNKRIQQSTEVKNSLYTLNPRLVPHGFMPTCQKMHFTVEHKQGGQKQDKGKKAQKDLRTMLLKKGSSSSSSSTSNNFESNLISEEEFQNIFPEGYRDFNYFEKQKEYWAMSKAKFESQAKTSVPNKLTTWLDWQRSLQKTINVGHSSESNILASLLQYSDAKRFELPVNTQNPSFGTQDFASQKIIQSPSKSIKPLTPTKVQSPAKPKPNKKKQKIPIIRSPGKKDGDIRALFSTATKSMKNYTKLINDLGINNDGSIPTSLINLLVDLKLNTNEEKKETCYICENICNCNVFKKLNTENNKPVSLLFIKELRLPNLDLIDDMDSDTILRCAKNDISLLESQQAANVSYLNVDKKNCSNNFDLEFDFDSPIDLTSPDNNFEDKNDENCDKNFDLGDIEDIFADTSPEEGKNKCDTNDRNTDKNTNTQKEALCFFGLDSIDDIFADSDDSINNNIQNTPEKKQNKSTHDTPIHKRVEQLENKTKISPIDHLKSKTVSPVNLPPSPSLLSGKAKPITTSPILGSQVRKFRLSTKKRNQMQSSTPTNNVKRCLIPESITKNNAISQDEQKSKSSVVKNSLVDTSNKSLFTITQLVEMINKTGETSMAKSNTKDKQEVDEDRSTSPILLTQADRKKINENCLKNKSNTTQNKRAESLIILESDSDSDSIDDTQIYDVDEKYSVINSKMSKSPEKSYTEPKNSPTKAKINDELNFNSTSAKRKLSSDEEDSMNTSPFFNKKPKLQIDKKKLSLQQRVLAALTSNQLKNTQLNNDKDKSVNFMFSPTKLSQKENEFPDILEEKQKSPVIDNDESLKEEYVRKNNLQMLQMFRRESKVKSPKLLFDSLLNTPSSQNGKRKLAFDDSDDDFVEARSERTQERKVREPVKARHKNESITNHKVRKKKPKANGLLDLEADISDDQSDSGDELSDDSVGSIIDFICDDNVTHHEDMQAHYLKSVKSPVRGMFKIPELPKRYEKEEIFSQFVEDDDNNYEMDSFCVDSHIGLTQANVMTELEVAEMILEQKRRKKKKPRLQSDNEENDGSPLVRKKTKARRINSDSEDSS